MSRSLKIMVLPAAFSLIANPLFAEWKVHHPMEGELYSYTSSIATVGEGDIGSSGSFKIKYLVNGKWRVTCEGDFVVSEKGSWAKNCKAPIAGWPTAKAPEPTPYMIELYDEKKILKHTNNFKVVKPPRKPK